MSPEQKAEYVLTKTGQSPYSLSALIRLQKARNSKFYNSPRDCGQRAPVSLSRGGLFLLMKKIPLTRGKYTLVDDQDYEFLNQWKWRVLRAKLKDVKDGWYAHRNTPRPNRKSIAMHRAVAARMGFPNTPEVDHKDHDGLNNQRYNLRPCTVRQNRWNRRKRSGCTSKYKGVYWHKRPKIGWMARIFCLGKHYYLGMFDSERDAAKAYDVAARSHFGEFAKLNFP